MSIKLHSFNCRGMQDYFKRRKIFHYLRSIGSDIIFLQETHSDPNDEKLWSSQWGETIVFASFNSNSRGVAILFRNSITLKIISVIKDPNGRYIVLNAKVNDLPLTLVNIYAPNSDDSNFLLDVFAEVDKLDNSFLLIGGDFNAVIGPLDYQGTRQQHCNVKASDTISLIMNEYNLCDVWRLFNPTLKSTLDIKRYQKFFRG